MGEGQRKETRKGWTSNKKWIFIKKNHFTQQNLMFQIKVLLKIQIQFQFCKSYFTYLKIFSITFYDNKIFIILCLPKT